MNGRAGSAQFFNTPHTTASYILKYPIIVSLSCEQRLRHKFIGEERQNLSRHILGPLMSKINLCHPDRIKW